MKMKNPGPAAVPVKSRPVRPLRQRIFAGMRNGTDRRPDSSFSIS